MITSPKLLIMITIMITIASGVPLGTVVYLMDQIEALSESLKWLCPIIHYGRLC